MAAQNITAAVDDAVDDPLLLFGHLIPLGGGGKDTPLLTNSTTQLLSLPASFGRAELLEPYAKKKCSDCRHIEKDNNEEKKKKPTAAVIGLCQFCQSIQSLAKFISRRDFLNFSYDGASKDQQHRQLVLTVSARNTAKLVRVSSTRLKYNNNKVTEQNTKDGMVQMMVNDGDVVSICWYQRSDGGGTSSKELKPLIQFRVYKYPNHAASKEDDHVSIHKNHIEQTSVRDGDLKAGSGFSSEAHLNTNNTPNKDGDGLLFRPDDGISKRERDSQESSEEEEESAPLSLPSKFLASSSKSYSFDSQLHSASPPKAILHAAACSDVSSQKRKTPPQTWDATSSSFATTKTPKKSNVQAPNHGGNDRSANKDNIPLSSLSYDQLLQLRDQSTTSTSSSTSLRHNVLSLALALSSNASAYDSNFLKEIQDFRTPAKTGRDQANDEGSGNKNGDSKNSVGTEANTRQWMPRLLQGTEMILNKKSNDKK